MSSNLRLKTAIASSLALFLASQITHAEVTYRLVTDNDMIIDRCVYLMVAEDLDIAASKDMANPNGIKTTKLVHDSDIITLPEGHNIGEFALRYMNGTGDECQCDAPERHIDYIWGFKELDQNNTNNFLMYFNTDGIQYADPYASKNRNSHRNTTVSVDPISNTVTATFFSFGQNGILSFSNNTSGDYILNTFKSDAEGLHRVKFYRKDVYDLRVIEMKKTTDGYDIEIHINTYESENDYSKGSLMYVFSDEAFLSNDDIFHLSEKNIISNYNSGNLKLSYQGNKKYLWLIRDHGKNYYATDAIRVELKEMSQPATSAEDGHFTPPQAQNYNIGNVIDFEPKEKDVKIFYTLDGKDPVVPGTARINTLSLDIESDSEAENHEGKTYDIDIRPIVYDGSPLSIRYVAVKTGHSPSKVGVLEIAGTSTGIGNIETNQSSIKTKYYNLQGVQVSHPLSPGIYIRISNGNAEKIIIR